MKRCRRSIAMLVAAWSALALAGCGFIGDDIAETATTTTVEATTTPARSGGTGVTRDGRGSGQGATRDEGQAAAGQGPTRDGGGAGTGAASGEETSPGEGRPPTRDDVEGAPATGTGRADDPTPPRSGRPTTTVAPGDYGIFCANSRLALVDLNGFDTFVTRAGFAPEVVLPFADRVVRQMQRAAEGYPDDPLREDIAEVAAAYRSIVVRMRSASNADELRQVLDSPVTSQAVQGVSQLQDRIADAYVANCPE